MGELSELKENEREEYTTYVCTYTTYVCGICTYVCGICTYVC